MTLGQVAPEPAGSRPCGGGDSATRMRAGRDLHIGQSLLLLPVPHRQHVVIGVVHSAEVASSVLKDRGVHKKAALRIQRVRHNSGEHAPRFWQSLLHCEAHLPPLSLPARLDRDSGGA